MLQLKAGRRGALGGPVGPWGTPPLTPLPFSAPPHLLCLQEVGIPQLPDDDLTLL